MWSLGPSSGEMAHAMWQPTLQPQFQPPVVVRQPISITQVLPGRVQTLPGSPVLPARSVVAQPQSPPQGSRAVVQASWVPQPTATPAMSSIQTSQRVQSAVLSQPLTSIGQLTPPLLQPWLHLPPNHASMITPPPGHQPLVHHSVLISQVPQAQGPPLVAQPLQLRPPGAPLYPQVAWSPQVVARAESPPPPAREPRAAPAVVSPATNHRETQVTPPTTGARSRPQSPKPSAPRAAEVRPPSPQPKLTVRSVSPSARPSAVRSQSPELRAPRQRASLPQQPQRSKASPTRKPERLKSAPPAVPPLQMPRAGAPPESVPPLELSRVLPEGRQVPEGPQLTVAQDGSPAEALESPESQRYAVPIILPPPHRPFTAARKLLATHLPRIYARLRRKRPPRTDVDGASLEHLECFIRNTQLEGEILELEQVVEHQAVDAHEHNKARAIEVLRLTLQAEELRRRLGEGAEDLLSFESCAVVKPSELSVPTPPELRELRRKVYQLHQELQQVRAEAKKVEESASRLATEQVLMAEVHLEEVIELRRQLPLEVGFEWLLEQFKELAGPMELLAQSLGQPGQAHLESTEPKAVSQWVQASAGRLEKLLLAKVPTGSPRATPVLSSRDVRLERPRAPMRVAPPKSAGR